MDNNQNQGCFGLIGLLVSFCLIKWKELFACMVLIGILTYIINMKGYVGTFIEGVKTTYSAPFTIASDAFHATCAKEFNDSDESKLPTHIANLLNSETDSQLDSSSVKKVANMVFPQGLRMIKNGAAGMTEEHYSKVLRVPIEIPKEEIEKKWTIEQTFEVICPIAFKSLLEIPAEN